MRQALLDGYDYLWADTVCIDKSSSAELSEAINSMFKWYRQANVAYGYLCDLEDARGEASGLEDCRWFSRGWTLQEMIAARNLRFYDRNWVFQGDKTSLIERLSRITRVDERALRGGNLRFFSVARKMSWASCRETSREEDMAYCLLGIFDINMPLLYGEGSKAFIRLQEEIIKQFDDESLFAWQSSDVSETSGLLAPSPAVFASSADIAPCLTPDATQSMSGPLSVTSRGVRMKVPMVEINTGTKRVEYLFRLNCKRVSYGRVSGIRMAIIVAPVAKIQGYQSDVSMYSRVHPDRLETFAPNSDVEPRKVYVLKENRLQEFDLGTYDVFLIRTMPLWPPDRQFRLVQALPPAAWDDRNDTFKRQSQEAGGETPFVLVFRRASAPDSSHQRHSPPADYFIIAMGRTIKPSHVVEGINGGSFWCNAVYCRESPGFSVEREVGKLTVDQGKKTDIVKGAGVSLKCHVRPEVMSGQQLFFVDLLVETMADDGDPRLY